MQIVCKYKHIVNITVFSHNHVIILLSKLLSWVSVTYLSLLLMQFLLRHTLIAYSKCNIKYDLSLQCLFGLSLCTHWQHYKALLSECCYPDY